MAHFNFRTTAVHMVNICTITSLKYTVSPDTNYMSALAVANSFILRLPFLVMLCINMLFLLLFREPAL